jgi:hypothetical protein
LNRLGKYSANKEILRVKTGIATGLFNAHYSPLYERLMAGSRAALHMALAIFVAPLALAILSA